MSIWHDAQYLFRLTSTFGWDEASALCDELVTGIEQAAATADAEANTSTHSVSSFGYLNDMLYSSKPNDCKSVEEWLQLASNQLMYQDQWGNTPLHAASYVHPPLHVIQALFRAGRAIWKYSITQPKIPIWAIPATDNSTPFLVACSTGAATDVLQCYLDEVEYYIEQNLTDCSARMLVLKPDDQGTNPLMGWTSFHRGWMLHTKGTPSGRNGETNYLELAIRMVMFATMQTYTDSPPSNQMMVRRCALVASQCPVFLLQWLVDVNTCEDGAETRVSKSECAAIRDKRNKLPLHNAIESPTSLMFGGECNSSENAKTTHYETNRNQVIETLLNWHPKAAGEHFPNGRTPLCEAIARGDHWHAADSKPKSSKSNGVIKMLYEHAPDKLLERDAVTGLYPFMLAAITSADSEATGAIDTIYSLLRRDPQLVVDCS